MQPRRAERRDVAADLRWGIAWGLVLTAICLTPAAIVYLAGASRGRAPTAGDLSFGRVLLLYGSMAVTGGALVGACRPALRSRGGTLLVGALVGAATFTILLWRTSATGEDAWWVRGIGAALGAFAGVGLAAYMRWRWGKLRRGGHLTDR